MVEFRPEAMASGVPLICTPHGTTAFARDGETAVVLGEASPAGGCCRCGETHEQLEA